MLDAVDSRRSSCAKCTRALVRANKIDPLDSVSSPRADDLVWAEPEDMVEREQ